MSMTAIIPGSGLEPVRPTPQGVGANAESSSDKAPITASPSRIDAPQAGGNAPGTGSGFGDGARANLFGGIAGQEQPKLSADGLTEEQEAVVQELSARDREVRNHEEAHARVGGQYAGQPSYTYQTGPDGKRYAIGGEVPIDVAKVPDDPEATIAKMDVVIAAALAPAEPSGQDRRVAALAARQRVEAMADLNRLRQETLTGGEVGADDSLQFGNMAEMASAMRVLTGARDPALDSRA